MLKLGMAHSVENKGIADIGRCCYNGSWIAGGYKKITQRDRLREGVDIVVGTPGRLNLFLEEKELNLQQCQYVILDECDILLGDASLFADQVHPLASACITASSSKSSAIVRQESQTSFLPSNNEAR